MRTIEIAADTCVLIVDDSIARRHWFLSAYRVPQAYLAHTPEDAINIIRRHTPDMIWLDYDLAPGIDSVRFAEFLRDSKFAGPVMIHSENPFGKQVLKRILPSAQVIAFGSFDIVRNSVVS